MTGKSVLILLGIVLIGLLIRIYRIQSLPMYGDELTMVYDTYSILKTGKDATGQAFPLTFKMGAGRPGGYIYASIPFVYLFGPTQWGVRSVSLLSSVGIMLLMYLLARKLLSEKAGLVAGFLTAISLWDIYLARGGFEAHFALFLALSGIVLFLYGKFIPWAITWGLAVFTYPTFKLTLPLMFLIIIWYSGIKKVIKNKIFIASLVILALFGGLAIKESFAGLSEQRFLSQNIFVDKNLKESIIQRVNYERTASSLPDAFKPVFINRGIEYFRIALENYTDNISPNFLILRGDGNPRHNPGEMGMIYLIDLPLVLIALAFLYQNKRKEFILLLAWILITPLATMFFPEAHALRNGLMLPPLILLSAFALTKIPKRMAYVAVFLMAIQFLYVLLRIYTIAPVKFASFWSAEAKAASERAIEDSKAGKPVVLSTKIDNIEYAYEVYAKVDPNLVINQYGRYPKNYGKVMISYN